MPDPELLVVTLADDRYAMPLCVCVRSLLDHLGAAHSVRVLILNGGISEANKSRLVQSWRSSQAWARCAIEWIEPRYGDSDLPVWGRMPTLTYARIGIADCMPTGRTKAILLDSDVLVLQDLGRLWSVPFESGIACAAQDPFIPYVGAREGLQNYQELGLKPDAKYFNAGIMLIDVMAWRHEAVAQRAYEFIARHRGHLRNYDQDALNAALAGRWTEIDPRWNAHPRLSGVDRTREDPSTPWIVHFSGRLKPWAFRGTSAADRAFFEHLDRTVWHGWRPPFSLKAVALSLYQGIFRRYVYPLEVRAHGLLRKIGKRSSSTPR